MLHLQVVELTRSLRCFTREDINGKAPVPGTGMGMNMGVSFMGLPPVDQKQQWTDGGCGTDLLIVPAGLAVRGCPAPTQPAFVL